MQWTTIEADQVTISIVLGVCAGLEAPQQGNEVHGHVIRNGFDLENPIGNALLTML